MNNEPVAWTKKDTLVFLGNYEFGSITIQVQKQKDDEFDIPLYTHPINAVNISEQYVDKTQNNRHKLTDEEILNTWKECGESDIAKDMQANSFLKYFARKILRKAQEKC